MTMMLELSSRMIDYLPEEVSKIQRTIELAVSETRTEEEMFAKVDSVLLTTHMREGAREFWDVWSNASDYAEPLTEGVGVNDNQTWPAQICSHIPNSVNLNFGVGGRSNDFIVRCLLSYFDLISEAVGASSTVANTHSTEADQF